MFFRKNSSKSKKPKAKIVALMNQKGGVGKTTMSYNLAFALKEAGKKVLCLDFDPQANLTALFTEKQSEKTTFQLLINSIRELKALHSPTMLNDVLVNKNGVDCLMSGQDLSGFELTVAGINAPRQLLLKNFLASYELDQNYDYIVIDGPPTLGLLVVNIMCAADGLFFPFIPDRFSEQGISNIHQVMDDVMSMQITNEPQVLGYIPNLFEKRRKQANDDFQAIESQLDPELIMEPFYNKATLAKAMRNGKSVFDFGSKDFKDFQTLFTHMADRTIERLGDQ